MWCILSEEELDVNELIKLLSRISERIHTIEYAAIGMIYLSWAFWVSLISIVSSIMVAYKLPDWTFYTILFTTLILAAFIINYKLPGQLILISQLAKLGYRREISSKAERKAGILYVVTWLVSFSILGILGSIYGILGVASGLLFSLGTGNLAIHLITYKYYRVLIRGGMILSLLFYPSVIVNIPLSTISIDLMWSYTLSTIIAIYLLFALYYFMLAFR